MNLDAIKKRLDALNSQASQKGNDSNSMFWKPSVGKQVVRIVPSVYNKEDPFTEMKVYYSIGKKVMASPMNWGQKDPIVAFVKQLRSTNSSENWKLAKKLDPKSRYMVPVVVRGEESEGVRLWQFGKETYQDFLNLAMDEEIGDFSDVVEGRDIKLTTVGPEVTGTQYNKTTISPSLKSSQLSDSADEVETFLNKQPDPFKTFKQYSFDEVKQALQDYLTPSEDEEEEEEVKIPSTPTPKTNYALNVKPKQKPGDKFEDLFD
jgi:hypothetical protein